MTLAEFAQMVQVMLRDLETWHKNMTHAAAMKLNYSERQVSRAVKQILDDAPTDEPHEVAVCQK